MISVASWGGGGGGGGGGVGAPIGAVSRAITVVKMQSNSHGTFWGSVKRSSSFLAPTSSIAWRPRGVVRFAHAQLVDSQQVKGKIRSGQAINAIFRW